MYTLKYVIFILITVCSVTAEFQVRDAVFSGFTHAAVMDVVHEPIKNALNPTVIQYLVCRESKDVNCITEIIANKEKCYTNILDYTIIIPPNPVLIFLSNVLILILLISFIGWCFTSTIDEKMEMMVFICCHLIGQIIYDILHGDDDD